MTIENSIVIKIMTSIYRVHFSKFFIVLLLLFVNQNLFAQNKFKNSDSTSHYKNAIKGSVTLLYLGGIYAGFSVGYERNISKHSVLEM